MRTVNLSLPEDLLARFDAARGPIPRSILIRELMRGFLEKVRENE